MCPVAQSSRRLTSSRLSGGARRANGSSQTARPGMVGFVSGSDRYSNLLAADLPPLPRDVMGTPCGMKASRSIVKSGRVMVARRWIPMNPSAAHQMKVEDAFRRRRGDVVMDQFEL